MGRVKRVVAGGLVYHVLNRSSGGRPLFETDADYQAFLDVMREAAERVDTRLLAYCIMPNHWHLVLYPKEDGDLSNYMGWLTLTHAQRWHAARKSAGSGHVYQGPFKSFPVQQDEHFLTVARYVERNALKSGLVQKAQDWKWASLGQRALDPATTWLHEWPVERPKDWLNFCNQPQTDTEVNQLKESIARGRPFGGERWQKQTAQRLGLQFTLNPRGRPPKGGHPTNHPTP